MKRSVVSLILSLGVSSAVFAQDVVSPPAARSSMATRPPNVANSRGTDSGAGVACNLLIDYGAVQAPGQAALPYGGNYGFQAVANPWADTIAAEFATATARAGRGAQAAGAGGARAGGGGGGGGLGAAGIATRGTVIPTAPMLPYENVEPPHPPTGTQFSNVASVGLLKNGHVIVFQRQPMYELMEYDADNRLVRTFDPNIASRPHGMFIDKDENIWLSDLQCSTVTKLNLRGEVLMRLGTNGKAGSWDEAKGDHLFNEPTAVAIGPKGDIFVSTGHGGPDPRIVRFDKNGKFITTWTLKHEEGDTAPRANIHAMTVDKQGTVFIGDREAKRLLIYDSSGKHLKTVQMPDLICSLYIDSKDQLWMTAGFDGMFMRLDKNGKILAWAGKAGFDASEFGEAHAMTISADGKTIYVADTVNNDIKRYRRTN